MKALPFVGVCLLVTAVLTACDVASAQSDSWPTKPDASLTPGLARDDLTLDEICTTKWGTDARSVTAAMKQQVMDEYAFKASECPLTHLNGKAVHRVEIDHLIPRDLGGADDVRNLWPECYEQVEPNKSEQEDGAHKKDQLETRLNKELCKDGHPTQEKLDEYRTEIKTDWIALYHKIYGDN